MGITTAEQALAEITKLTMSEAAIYRPAIVHANIIKVLTEYERSRSQSKTYPVTVDGRTQQIKPGETYTLQLTGCDDARLYPVPAYTDQANAHTKRNHDNALKLPVCHCQPDIDPPGVFDKFLCAGTDTHTYSDCPGRTDRLPRDAELPDVDTYKLPVDIDAARVTLDYARGSLNAYDVDDTPHVETEFRPFKHYHHSRGFSSGRFTYGCNCDIPINGSTTTASADGS